ncbi:MAG: hypothetical protein AAFY10_10290, partial [Pseudomonadota bacterium]
NGSQLWLPIEDVLAAQASTASESVGGVLAGETFDFPPDLLAATSTDEAAPTALVLEDMAEFADPSPGSGLPYDAEEPFDLSVQPDPIDDSWSWDYALF